MYVHFHLYGYRGQDRERELSDLDVPVIHMGMIVGRRGASIKIRPLQTGGQ